MCNLWSRREWMQGMLGALPVGALMSAGLMRTIVAESAPTSPMSEQALRFYYGFLGRFFYECPTDLQVAAIELAEDIYQHTDGWQRDQLTQADREKTAAHIHALMAELEQQFYTVTARWGDTGLTRLGNMEPLSLAQGIPRYVLVWVENSLDSPQQFTLTTTGTPSYPWPACDIAPGERLPYWLPITVQEAGSGETTLEVTSDSDTRTLSIPWQSVEPTRITGTLHEYGREGVWPGRVYVQCDDNVFRHGDAFADNTTLSEKPVVFRPASYRFPFFYSDGHFEISVPPGATTVTLERGFEHRLTAKSVHVEPGASLDVCLESDRFIDMGALGWISGDTHIHWAKNSWDVNEDLDLLAMVQRAEDLRVANNLTLYQWTPDGPFIKPDQYPMGPVPGHCDGDYHIQMGEEYRNDGFYGHINLLGITDIIEPISTGPGSGGDENALDYPLNKTAIEECHRQGGISCEAHGFGPFENGSIPINVINGLSDAIDQLDPRFYYLLLDCGFRIPLGNGSDHPARIAGCARVYVKVDGSFSYARWLDGIRAKRTFITSGPLLFLTVDDADIGSVLDRNADATIHVEARAVARHPIGALEVVSNGDVIRRIETEETEARLSFDMPVKESRWLVARCAQGDVFAPLKTAEDYYSARPHIAHTSAVYVDVAGKPVCKPEAIEQIVHRMGMLRQRIATEANFADDKQRSEALEYIDDGIRQYEARMRRYG